LAAGVTASIGNNRHRYAEGAVNGKRATAWNAGLYTQLNFGRWALRPKFLWEHRAAPMPLDLDERTSTHLSTGAIDIPIDIIYKLRLDRSMKEVYYYVLAGGSWSRIMTASLDDRRIDFSATGNGNDDGNLRIPLRNEWGWHWGFGVNIYKFWLEGNFNYGISKVFPRGGAIRNQSGYFTVGYRF
jgi:hypothetical protein